ncbi:uncharacterized protein [Leptinotarsa decemlineata]|uniref:uncharacterized protein n=1 Tax=Leptinotarsa decemlineata TaxID=7539 RepID=UPI003D30475E
MSDRTKKIMRLAYENMGKQRDVSERSQPTTSHGTSLHEPGMEDDDPTKEGPQISMWPRYAIHSSTPTKLALRKHEPCKQYASPISSDDEKLFSSGSSDLYEPSDESSSEESSTENITSSASLPINKDISAPDSNEATGSEDSQPKKAKKRTRNEKNWKQNVAKRLKNSGKSYKSRTNKTIEARKMRPPCSDKCVLSCSKNFPYEKRVQKFNEYWALGSLQRQRDYLYLCIEKLELKYRRISSCRPRKPNCCFYFMNDKKIRICKTFFINTLGISERAVRTVIDGKLSGNGFAPLDNRGKHNKHKKIDDEILNSVRHHINKIPRIESHYVRRDTSREFIDGALTIADIHRHYCSERSMVNKPAVNYDAFAKIFNTEFNIGFFIPKKDQCDRCESYKNAVDKSGLEEEFKKHQEEKKLSRIEKALDKEKAAKSEIQLVVYDLQAVLPVPMGQTSTFFYKSRLNCFNFTVTEIMTSKTNCYFWHEGLGNRGVNEIATGVYLYIEELSRSRPGSDIIFYSDNCGGQQKNKYMMAMYLFAVGHLDVHSITHKYLIRGHTQNEGDAVHSIIERNLKRTKRSGPIYVPDQYVSVIRNAKKKGEPLKVKEMGYADFFDFKSLYNRMSLNVIKDTEGNPFKVSEIKQIRFEKGSDVFQYKNSFKEVEWKEVDFKKRISRAEESLSLTPAYSRKIPIPGNKLKDLMSLINNNMIPSFYKPFYDSLK